MALDGVAGIAFDTVCAANSDDHARRVGCTQPQTISGQRFAVRALERVRYGLDLRGCAKG